VLRPERLAAVRRTGLLDTGAEEPFDRLTRLACELLGAPFGFVTVVDESRSFWKSCVGITSSEVADRQNPVGESFCQYVIDADDAVIIDDARLNPMTSDNPSITSMGVIAWAGFPVRSPDGHVLGSFCVVDSTPRRWTAQDRRTLEVLAHAASGEVALRVAAGDAVRQAARAQADADRYQQLAATLQESLLPRDLPDVPGLDVAAAFRAVDNDVFGDFFDVVPTPTGWAVFLGDVAGKGAHAARTSALAKYTLRACAVRASSPGIVITELDTALHRWFAETRVPGFVTAAYLALRATDGGFRARVCTAGHPVAAIRRAGGPIEAFGQTSSPLGILPSLSLKVDDADLYPGDTLLLYSNGVTVDHAGFATLLRDAPAGPAQAVADTVLGRALEVHDGRPDDDMAVLAVTIR